MFNFFRKCDKKIRINARSIAPVFHRVRLHVQERMVTEDSKAEYLDFFAAEDADRIRWFKVYAEVELEIEHPKNGKFEVYFVFEKKSDYTMFLLKWS